MSEAETKRKFDEIVDFADIGKLLDTPVGHYCSGMFARLGFAVAIHVDSDIFLADEVLAVGDKPFKRSAWPRCRRSATAAAPSSTSATPPGSVRQMCDRVIVLEKGRLGFDGDVDAGIKYLEYDDATTTGPRRTRTTSSAPTSRRDPAAGSRPSPMLDKSPVIPACRLEITTL